MVHCTDHDMPRALATISRSELSTVRVVLTDFDDTLTLEGKLPADTLSALYRLQEAGLAVVPVTGGCAGWSDMMVRVLPISGVITEGGGVFMQYRDNSVHYHYFQGEMLMRAQQAALLAMIQPRLERFQALQLTRDQAYRLTDVAIDYAQDIHPPALSEKDALLKELRQLGLNAKASSIHINVCQDGVDKYAMSQQVLREVFEMPEHEQQRSVLYVGDAPNDESMFANFPLSVGVANIEPYLPNLKHKPAFITNAAGGLGFAELASLLLEARG